MKNLQQYIHESIFDADLNNMSVAALMKSYIWVPGDNKSPDKTIFRVTDEKYKDADLQLSGSTITPPTGIVFRYASAAEDFRKNFKKYKTISSPRDLECISSGGNTLNPKLGFNLKTSESIILSGWSLIENLSFTAPNGEIKIKMGYKLDIQNCSLKAAEVILKNAYIAKDIFKNCKISAKDGIYMQGDSIMDSLIYNGFIEDEVGKKYVLKDGEEGIQHINTDTAEKAQRCLGMLQLVARRGGHSLSNPAGIEIPLNNDLKNFMGIPDNIKLTLKVAANSRGDSILLYVEKNKLIIK